jgi:hypothetical protein
MTDHNHLRQNIQAGKYFNAYPRDPHPQQLSMRNTAGSRRWRTAWRSGFVVAVEDAPGTAPGDQGLTANRREPGTGNSHFGKSLTH